jgi:tRNA(Ile)-lysidine synthase
MIDTPPPILQEIEAFCSKNRLIARQDKILLAVSGGPDSTALLYVFHDLQEAYEFELAVAHVNHGIRGADADIDQQFVRDIAAALGLRFFSTKLRLEDLKGKRESPEEAARRARYTYLFETMKQEGFDKLATGHTLEDNIETILYRLASGTGPGGASGIHPQNGVVIHPLLTLSKKRILEYLQKSGTDYRIDRTNFDWSIPRNRIRYEILPLFERINRKYREHFGTFALVQREENELLKQLTDRTLETILESRDEFELRLNYGEFIRLDAALRRRVVIRIYEQLIESIHEVRKPFLPFKVLDGITSGMTRGNKILYENNSISVLKEYDSLVFKKRVVDTRRPGYLYHVTEIGSSVVVPDIGKELVFSLSDTEEIFEKQGYRKNKIYFDFDKVRLPISIRSRTSGDRITLANLGHKKLKDLFIDHKVSIASRDCVPVLESNNQVIGVFCSFYGMDNRVSEDFMITDSTVNVLVGELRDWKT